MGENVFQMYLEELGKIRCCDEAENDRLFQALSAGDPAARARLIEGNLKAVLEVARDYLNKGVLAEDLVQEANMALVMAVGEYEGYEGGGFEGFLRQRVREALGAAVESQALERRTAEKMVARVNRLKDISAEMAEELGREATVEELARRMELTGDEIRDAMKVTLDAMSVLER